MVEKIEDLNFPTAVVTRLIKDALPATASLSKEARTAITRAASVFVIYLSTSSTTLARKDKHKTVTAQNVLDALELLEFESFVQPLKEELEIHRKAMKEKKDNKSKKDVEENGPSTSTTEENISDEANSGKDVSMADGTLSETK